MEAPPPESPPDPDDIHAAEEGRPKRPSARRALGRGLHSILTTTDPADQATPEIPREAAHAEELESLLEQARDELRRLGELEQQLEEKLNGKPDEAARPPQRTTNGVLSEVSLRGLNDFGHALEVAERLPSTFNMRSYEDGTLTLAVVPARRLADEDVEALASAACAARLRQDSHSSFTVQ